MGVAIAIAVIVDTKFWTYISGYWGWSYVVVQDTCYLGSYNSSMNLCYFNWVMAGIGGFILLFLFFLSLCFRGAGRPTIFLIMFVVAAAIFLADGIVNSTKIDTSKVVAAPTTTGTTTTSGDSVTNLSGWRHAIIGLSWTAFGLAALGTLATVMDFVQNKSARQQQVSETLGKVPAFMALFRQ